VWNLNFTAELGASLVLTGLKATDGLCIPVSLFSSSYQDFVDDISFDVALFELNQAP
jgi:hypothetical protein